MGNRACAFCLLKSSEDEAVQLNDEEIMAHPYQSAEDLSVHRRPQYSSSPSGANNNVALRTYVNESDIHLNGDSALFTPSREEPAPSSYQKTSSETKAEEEQNALRRQFEQLDVSQLQLKVDAVHTQDYPFLSDAYTVGVIKRSRVLFLLRGPSGLGKSTIASVIAAKYASSAVICSADDYFMHNGTYRFDPSRLRDAHEYCQAKAQTAALSGSCVIIVDNTNIKRWESSFYIKLARENEYVVVEIIPKSAWGYDVDELVKHSRHGVPRETIQRTLGDFEQLRLQYWGWFVNTEDSQLIRSQAEVFFVQCQTNMREFSTALQTLGGFVPG
jgi:predicted kinase